MPAPIEICPATTLANLEALRRVMEDSVRHPLTNEVIHDEIDKNLQAIADSNLEGADRYFAIARIDDEVVGSMGLQTPITELGPFVTTANPVELINAYVSRQARGQGVGRLLVRHLEDRARDDGHTELLLNSGPRYMRSGWPFWRRMYGEPVGVLKDYYGQGFDAKVWKTFLDTPKD